MEIEQPLVATLVLARVKSSAIYSKKYFLKHFDVLFFKKSCQGQ